MHQGSTGSTRARGSRAAVAALLLALGTPGLAYDNPGSDYLRSLDPALGIAPQFGRWDGIITLVYDPDGAPALYADPDEVLALLAEAAAEWELVSGISFNVAGADSNVPDDDDLGPDDKDGLVRVYWTDTGGAAGRAGPDGGYYNADKGFYPYIDGSVQLNENPGNWDSPGELVAVLVHELGHLMGLGHSDNPDSVMYANPYNHLHHPRADDILAARAIYGDGSLLITDVRLPIAQWRYARLPDAPASATEYLFKANQLKASGAFISVGSDTPVTTIDDATADNEYIRFNFGGIGNYTTTENIDIDASLHVVDPFGYLYDLTDHRITCNAHYACDGGWVSVGTTEAAKTIPGTWTVYVVDNTSMTTLASLPFSVDTRPVFNQAPTAQVSVSGVAGTLGKTVKVSLALADPEGHDIDVIWHPHGNLGDQDNDGYLDTQVTDSAADGEVISRNIAFLSVDTHTLYIELVDNQPRYDGTTSGSSTAGDGFQSLIAVTVSLPYVNEDDVTVVSSFLPASDDISGTTDAVVSAIANTQILLHPSTSDRQQSSAIFAAGATADAGASTATTFASGDTITIAGSVSPQAADVGKGADLYVVLYKTTDETTLTFRDLNGLYQNWGGVLKDNSLQPAYEITALGTLESFEVYSGTVQSGLYRVFLGYRLADGGPIHFNASAFRIDVN